MAYISTCLTSLKGSDKKRKKMRRQKTKTKVISEHAEANATLARTSATPPWFDAIRPNGVLQRAVLVPLQVARPVQPLF